MTKDTNNKNTLIDNNQETIFNEINTLKKKVDTLTLTIHQKNNYISDDEIITNYSFKKEPSELDKEYNDMTWLTGC